MKNRKTAVLLGAAALTAALGLGYGLLTGVLTLLAPSVAPGPLENVNLLEFPAHLMTEASAEFIAA